MLKGEMSLVGPRPLMISDLEVLKNKYPQYYRDRNLITVKPGITGMWQVFGNRNEGIENLIVLDLYYDEQTSLSVDLRILLSTILLVSRGKHSDAVISGMSYNKEWNTLSNTHSLRALLKTVVLKNFTLRTQRKRKERRENCSF